MMGVLMFVVKNPEFSSKLGMIGTKAAMLRFGDVDWQTDFGLLNQIIAGGGINRICLCHKLGFWP